MARPEHGASGAAVERCDCSPLPRAVTGWTRPHAFAGASLRRARRRGDVVGTAKHRPNASLRDLTDVYIAQYDAAPSSVASLRDNMRAAVERFGDEPIGSLTVQRIATWRASVPEGKRYRSHRALRQVLQAAVRWRWIEDNPAVHVKNPEPRAGEIDPFSS